MFALQKHGSETQGSGINMTRIIKPEINLRTIDKSTAHIGGREHNRKMWWKATTRSFFHHNNSMCFNSWDYFLADKMLCLT